MAAPVYLPAVSSDSGSSSKDPGATGPASNSGGAMVAVETILSHPLEYAVRPSEVENTEGSGGGSGEQGAGRGLQELQVGRVSSFRRGRVK